MHGGHKRFHIFFKIFKFFGPIFKDFQGSIKIFSFFSGSCGYFQEFLRMIILKVLLFEQIKCLNGVKYDIVQTCVDKQTKGLLYTLYSYIPPILPISQGTTSIAGIFHSP